MGKENKKRKVWKHFHDNSELEIEKLLKLDDKELMKKVSKNAKNLKPNDVKSLLINYKEKGLKFIPVCNNYNKNGLCKGHQVSGKESRKLQKDGVKVVSNKKNKKVHD